ncbi:Uncharacterised protein [uncultured archaeon]|nr:Uncharacterised protein [uncultured archaeon]
MKSEYKSRLAIGLVLLLLGIAAENLLRGAHSPFTTAMIVVGLVLIIGSVLRHLKFREEADRDERTTRIGAFALAYSWLVTFIFMSLLLMLDYYLVKLTAFQALFSSMAVAILVAGFFQWHFRRKGGVE